MSKTLEPALLDRWFPPELQRRCVEKLLKEQGGLTRRRAECFVRLWAYLMLKQQNKLPESPISSLMPIEGSVSCTHREAAELFYTNTERGSERAAGMMINQLINAGLVRKTFDGNTTSLGIWTLQELTQPQGINTPYVLKPDSFDPRNDAVPVASFLAHNYNWMTNSTASINYKIARLLRQWSSQYSTGMRVLRRSDTLQAVGFYVLFPTASASEENFFLPPSRSLHLSTADVNDPIEMAQPGDPDCLAIFVRSWMIDAPYKDRDSTCLFLRDAQEVLINMRKDFPNLCDIYALPIQPVNEAMVQALGFQKTVQDPQSSLSWAYLALDRFLALNVEDAIA